MKNKILSIGLSLAATVLLLGAGTTFAAGNSGNANANTNNGSDSGIVNNWDRWGGGGWGGGGWGGGNWLGNNWDNNNCCYYDGIGWICDNNFW